MKKRIILLLFSTLSLYYTCVFADSEPSYDLSGVANNILESVTFASDFIQTACFLLGGSFLFASIIKYIEHKRSPLMVPISTVVFLVIAGIILIILPFLSYFVDNGVSYTLMQSKPS